MKTLNSILLFGALSLGLKAQTLKVFDLAGVDVTDDTVEVVFQPSSFHGWSELEIFLHVKNTGSSPVELGVKKMEFNLQADEYHAFCFAGTCEPDFIYVSPFTNLVLPNQADSSFSGHFRFDDTLHTPGICKVAYVFYDVNNPSDSAIVYVKYNTLLQLGLETLASENMSLSQAWPNPANEVVNFNLQISNSSLIEHSVAIISTETGAWTNNPTSVGADGSIRFDTQALPPGIYTCVVLDGKHERSVRRFMVIH